MLSIDHPDKLLVFSRLQLHAALSPHAGRRYNVRVIWAFALAGRIAILFGIYEPYSGQVVARGENDDEDSNGQSERSDKRRFQHEPDAHNGTAERAKNQQNNLEIIHLRNA
jgi:hypothetical protein